MRFYKKLIIILFWFIGVSYIFNNFGYEIYEFNTKVRIFIKEGKLNHREFDKQGLPISYSARIGKFRSPFYIVHYGILYSENMDYTPKSNDKIWRHDPSLEYWNVYPDLSDQVRNEVYFKNSVDWLVENVDYSLNNKAHFIYNFDWPYKDFNNGKLESGWWSGLTDAYAIIPLLRAYEIYGEDKYYETAEDLYNSTLSNYEEYGSLTYLNDQPWIEEYMDKNLIDQSELPYVLNGMIYSTFGIAAFESLETKNNKKISSELFQSIADNIHNFNNNGWSHYDLYKTSNNIKYHLVHTSLLKYLIDKENLNKYNSNVVKISKLWSHTSNNPGSYYLIRGNKSLSYFHFLGLYLLVLSLPIIFFYIIKLRNKYARN